MIARSLVRPAVTFLVCSSVGLLVLFFVLGEDRGPPRRGMHVQAIGGTGGGPRPSGESPWADLPVEGPVDRVAFRRYEEVALASGKTVKVLGWFARAADVTFGDGGKEFVARDLDLRVCARPRTEEEVRRKPVILSTIRTPRARAREEEGQVVLLADREVHVVSAAGARSSTLDAEDLACRLTDRTVSSRGRVRIVSDRYVIEGTGLAGNVDLASSFEVKRDVTVTLPAAALLGTAASDPDAVTVIRSPGPMLLEKLEAEKGKPVPLRITFRNGVEVVQNEGAPGGPDTLRAGSLVLDLAVRKVSAESGGAGAEQVSLTSLDARGEVVLTRGRESRITGDRLVLRTSGGKEEVVLSGPATVHHEGPGAGLEALDLRAGAGGTLRRDLPSGTVLSEFRGGVHVERGGAERQARDLVLDAETVTLRRAPREGPDLRAAGNVRFRTPSATGTAARLRWSRRGPDRTGLLLTGDPRVVLRAGSSLGLPGDEAARPAPAEEGGRTVLACRGPLTLLTRGADHAVSLDEDCRLEEVEGDTVRSVLTADYLCAFVSRNKVKSVWAAGHVTAGGKEDTPPETPGEAERREPEGAKAAVRREYLGEGDEFFYHADRGRALLLGRPAVLRLTEIAARPDRPPGRERRRADEVRARRLTLDDAKPLVTGEGDVDALVFLRSAGTGRLHAFRLACDRLDLTPRREVPRGTRPGDLAGRILRLTARGRVVLEGRRQTGTGASLTYEGASGKVTLEGTPAALVRERTIAGRSYRDLFQADRFRVGLADGEIHSFRSSPGGRFRFHRPYRPGPGPLGPGARQEGKM